MYKFVRATLVSLALRHRGRGGSGYDLPRAFLFPSGQRQLRLQVNETERDK